MKKYLYTIITLVLALTACTNEVDDKFDKSSAERIEEKIREYQDILENAPNGWLMEFFGGGEDATVGGHNLICSFKDGRATVMSELAGNASEESLYKISYAQGPMLLFDSYNSLFHYFSDPSIAPPYGLEGDSEFIFTEVDTDMITLIGKKHRNKVLLKKLAADVVWDEYLNNVRSMKETTLNPLWPRYFIQKNGNSIADAFIANTNEFKVFKSGLEESSQNIIYNGSGFKFYKPITIDGIEYNSFTWDAASNTFTSEGDGEKLTLKGYMPEGYITYESYLGDYKATYIIIEGDDRTANNIALIEREYNNSFSVTEMTGDNRFDLLLTYDRFDGNIYFTSNDIYTDYDNQLVVKQVMWLGNPYNIDDLNFVMDQSYKYYGRSDGAEKPTYKFESSNPNSKHVGLFLLFQENGMYTLKTVEQFYANLIMIKK